jgi:serine/threonine protein phosphatase 1
MSLGLANLAAYFSRMSNLRAIGFRSASPPPTFPPGRVGFAIGDVHGRADLLDRLCARIEAEAERLRAAGRAPPIVIGLGDYVDRGLQSKQVLDLLASGRPRGCERRLLRGNHEQAMLAFLADPVGMAAWLEHGGAETLASFGVRPPNRATSEAELGGCAAAFGRALGHERLALIQGLETYLVLGDYLFVHAGVRPDLALDRQTEDTFLWVRAPFLDSDKRLPWVVVHGHTPADAPYKDRRRIGLDTGAYITGRLGYARFEGEQVETAVQV